MLRKRGTTPRRARRGIGVLLALAALPACGIASGEPASVSGKDTVVVGVTGGKPGLSFAKAGGEFEGFDIDVAREIARRLGARHVRLKQIRQREEALQHGDVDMVVASYSITPERKTKVVFAGPYYVAHQDTLVRGDDRTVRNVRDLRGRRLCQVTNSVSWRRVTEGLKISARLVPAPSYEECLNGLISGSMDAISTDDLILAGFAAQKGRRVRFVNAPISDEKYGVGLRPGDIRGCEDANQAITRMYQDGTAARLLTRWFGSTDLKLTTTVPQFEGCG